MQELGGQEIRALQRSSTLRVPGDASPQTDGAESSTFWPLSSHNWRAELGRVIESQILPRLMLAHSREPIAEPTTPSEPSAALDIAEFVARLLADDAEAAWSHVVGLRRTGRTSPEILLQTLAPAARQLGNLWETDQRDFVEVTVGLNRLHEILHRLSPAEEPIVRSAPAAHRALLLPTPGETHLFGVAIVETFFRAAGWRVQRGGADFADLLRSDWFDVVGLSLSAVRNVDSLSVAVRKARAASRNASIYVLVGGPVFADDAALAGRVGADATAIDAPGAVHLAQGLLRRRAAV